MLLLNYKPVLDQPTGIGVYANSIFPALQSLDHVFIPGGGSGAEQELFTSGKFAGCKWRGNHKALLLIEPD